MLKSKSEIEGFKSRLKQYRLAKSEDSLLNYWEWKGYAEDTGDVTDYKLQILKDVEMQNLLYDINHTDPNTGEKSPFYNRLTDDYGTVELPEVSVTAPITWKGVNALKAKRGAQAYYKGSETAFKLAAPIVAGAGLAAMAGAGLLSTAVNPIDFGFIAADPTQPLNYIPFGLQGGLRAVKGYEYLDKTLPLYSENVAGRLAGKIAHDYLGLALKPMLYRKLNTPVEINSEGKLVFSSSRTGNGHDGITNFTTDRPVVSHSKGNWDGFDTYVINPNVVDSKNYISIDPSDTFVKLLDGIYANRNQAIMITGNPESIKYALENNIKFYTNDELLRAWDLPEQMRPKSGLKGVIYKPSYSKYAKAMDKVARSYNNPTVKDYDLLSRETGLPSSVVKNKNSAFNFLKLLTEEDVHKAVYPNGRSVQLKRLGKERSLVGKRPYNNVFYDPATPIESSYRTLIQDNPDITVELFYKGLNAQGSYLNKAGGKDGKIFIPKYADGTEGIEDKYNFISKPPKDINTNSKAFNDWSLLAATLALLRSRSSNSPSGSKYTVKQKPNISEYLPFIWSEENSIKKGYDKNQDKWFPHNSVEGGLKTIGPGIKLNGGSYKPSNKEANKGMTEDLLNSYATLLFNYNLKRVDEYLGDYNDTISPQIKMGLADIRYQVGSLANFSKLKQAIKKGDIKKILKESKVHIEGLGLDKRRNELRKLKYFHYQ